MPTAIVEPAGACRDRADDVVGRADLIGHLDDLVRALGMHDHDAAGVLGAERLDVRGREPLVHRAVALPEQERGFLHLGVLEAAEPLAGVDDSHVGGAVAELEASVAAEVLVGEEEDLFAPDHLALRLSPSAQVSTARAFEEVHTAPPLRPTKAFSAAAEFM